MSQQIGQTNEAKLLYNIVNQLKFLTQVASKNTGGGGGTGASISDAVYSGSWNGDTSQGASRNALYDKINLIDGNISNLSSSKQNTLISGTNIKTINGTSILGSGDIVISGGGGTMATTTFTPYLTITSTNGQAAVEELKDELDAAVIASGTDVAPMSYTTVGGETTWVIGQTIPSQHKLFINGLKIIEGVDYTITGTTITYIGTILAGEVHELYFDIAVPTTYNASEVSVDASGFNGNLALTDDTVQKVAQKLDDLAIGGGGTVDVVKNVATSTILGRVTAGSGDSEELTPTQVRTLINVEDGATADQTASEVTVDASGFNGNLAITDDTVQKVAQKLDDLVIGGGGGSSLSTMAEIATQDFKELITYNKEWLLPSYSANVYTGTNGTNTRIHNNLTLIRASNSFDYPINIVFSSGTTAGTIASQNGQALGVFNGNSFYIKRGFYRSVVASGDRFSIGLSSAYRLGDPTNIEPDTQTNVLGIAKLSTSNNIHIIHNDASGVTTSFDLGTDYPATDTTLYYYTLEIYGVLGTSVTVKVTRITRSTGAEISTNQVITTNMPTVTISAFIWVTNNATAANSDIRDRGAIKYINTY